MFGSEAKEENAEGLFALLCINAPRSSGLSYTRPMPDATRTHPCALVVGRTRETSTLLASFPASSIALQATQTQEAPGEPGSDWHVDSNNCSPSLLFPVA